MCIRLCPGVLLILVSQAKSHPKAEMQIKPIDGTKFLQGRVAPPLWGCAFRGLPHLKIFFEIFCSNSFSIFFLILFYMLNFVKLCFIVYEVCIFVVFLSMICYG